MPLDYACIESAIRYLEESFPQRPRLDALARYLQLSPDQVERLFRRWVGISPRHFSQFLTLEYTKGLLEESQRLLEATSAAELSGPAQGHNLLVKAEGITPGQFKTRGAGLKICYGVHSSPFGHCLLAITERGICSLSFFSDGEEEAAITALQHRYPKPDLREDRQVSRQWVVRIFPRENGEVKEKLPLFLQGTPFQIEVWEALLKIPPGYVWAYEDVAKAIGQPRATRAVASAIGANPVSFLIPCHRVIRKVGLIGNYRWGPLRKRAILGWEAAQIFAKSNSQTT